MGRVQVRHRLAHTHKAPPLPPQVRLLGLAPSLRLALLPRSVTVPLALEMATMIHADRAIVILAVMVTGTCTTALGPPMLACFRVRDPVARGLALGGAAHGGGVLALVDEEEALPFAAIALAISGAMHVLAISTPPVRAALLRLALGGS